MKNKLFAICSLLFSTLYLSCVAQKINTLTPKETKEGWKLLFDGKSTKGWHLYNEGEKKSAWSAQDGELLINLNKENAERGDLVTDNEYTNYDFTFEWKIAKGGNSGVFINVKEDTTILKAWASGPEYQLLDNASSVKYPPKDSIHQAGCLYAMAPIKNKVASKPYTQWNTSRILQKDGVITFWLNGVETAHETINSDRWATLVASTSLKKFPSFGKATSGRIGLQDWEKGIAFRNIKIKVVK